MVSLNSVAEEDVRGIIEADLEWDRLRGTKVLVTGASGMLPSYVVRTLLALNDERKMGIVVYGLVRNEAKARALLADVLERPDFELVVQDISDPLAIEGGLDLIVHGASAARPSLHSANPIGTMRANLVGTMNVLDLAVDTDSTVVLMSSAEVYGQQSEDVDLIDEDSYGGFDILNPRACYSEGKRAAETLCAVYGAQHGVKSRIARFGHIYGPGMTLDDGRVQAEFTSKVLSGEDIVLNSDGSARRTYTYVADAVEGMFYALLVGGEQAYNVSDSDGLVSIKQLAEVFVSSRPELGLQVITKPADTSALYAQSKAQGLDNRKLRALGWTPHVPLPAGVDRTIRSHESR